MSDIYAEFISIVFSDDAELIENTLASSFSACLSGQILHRITENDSSVSGLGDRIAASEIRDVYKRQLSNDEGILNNKCLHLK